ncbi:phosphate signaling complex PhoU family protein [Corynebacterium sp. A21]|uniref:phosphate signaling complex PhoU family protein n=1 Tax=Corynebacterium sp. A21 TaxID=3457318 RepID=UPI003FD46726
MRATYHEQLDDFAHDLIIMSDLVRSIMAKASDALLRGSLESAETALSLSEKLPAIRTRCDQRAVDLFALESPLGRDLRQVISSIYIVENLDRMAALAMHIAESARRRHPDIAIPDALTGYFEEFTRLTQDMADKIHDLLIAPDADIAIALSLDDDAVDDLDAHLMTLLTQRSWPHTTRQAVDTALLVRFYERYADHCVSVATRLVYLTTGLQPEEYLARREQAQAEADVQARFKILEQQFYRGKPSFEQ